MYPPDLTFPVQNLADSSILLRDSEVLVSRFPMQLKMFPTRVTISGSEFIDRYCCNFALA
jgi:hypothetical protein